MASQELVSTEEIQTSILKPSAESNPSDFSSNNVTEGGRVVELPWMEELGPLRPTSTVWPTTESGFRCQTIFRRLSIIHP
ncbi:MAG: hypothetical protein QGI86_06375 [Candidatus Poribacteria bacterium]|nr:hypothetical protein [Candidatus Poribacteria bacterium]MDP6748193.1 hypothetical protein [Candidatus Poribacteria bacterium]MDP6997630.1 hypothetical protein [Candidatus Poribacteria bacterium]